MLTILSSYPTNWQQLTARLRDSVEARIEALVEERAVRLHLTADDADLRADMASLRKGSVGLAALNARLEHMAEERKRARFGPRSEKLFSDQLERAFEEIEAAMAEAKEAHEVRSLMNAAFPPRKAARRPRALPSGLPRMVRVLEPGDLTCPRGCADMVRIARNASTSRPPGSASS